jgi:hypothetical protein
LKAVVPLCSLLIHDTSMKHRLKCLGDDLKKLRLPGTIRAHETERLELLRPAGHSS